MLSLAVAALLRFWPAQERVAPATREQGRPSLANAAEPAKTAPAPSESREDGIAGARPVAPPPVSGAGIDQRAPLRRFDAWIARYLCEPDSARRQSLLVEGLVAADERRTALRELIAHDPEAALRAAVPWGVRQALPAAIAARLEERVSGIGEFRVIAARPADPAPQPDFVPLRREAVIEGRSYAAHVYGRRANLETRSGIGLHGIAVDGELALLDSPVRVLEPGEPAPPDRRVEELCAISGKPAGPGGVAPGEATIAADAGDRVYYLCSAGHIALLADGLLAQEQGPQAAGATAEAGPAAASSYTTGVKRVLFIRVRFADQAADFEPVNATTAQSLIDEAGAFFAANSGGAMALEGTVTPVYALPQSASWYRSNDSSGYALNVLQAARAVAAEPASAAGNAGLEARDYRDYDFEVVRYDGGPGAFSGQGYVGVRGCWLKLNSSGVLAHELGHNLGLWHANAWSPADPQTVVGPGTNVEYGDGFDTMGQASGGGWHFNTFEKNKLAWLSDAHVGSVTANGVRRVEAHDVGGPSDGSRPRALRVRRDADRDYWLEFRQHADWRNNRWISNGLGVRWDPWASSNGGTQLIDSTPFSSDARADSAVVIGRTFADPVAGIYVTPLAFGGTTPESLDVDVQIGSFTANRPPGITLSPSSLFAAVDSPVSFTAAAADPDGDALAYFWEFGDRSSGENAATVTKAWNAAGEFRVRVVATDRKGGTASASCVVRVGEPAGSRLAGRVVDLEGRPIAEVRVHNGLAATSALYREALSDSDGMFVLTGLSAGAWTLGATRPGWTFAQRGFANPVTTPAVDDLPLIFVGRAGGFRISGTVRAADGSPVRGAMVSDGTQLECTDANGVFVFADRAPGRVSLTAAKGAAAFDSVAVEVSLGDVNGVVIRETTFVVSGELRGVAAGTAATITDGARVTTTFTQGSGANARVLFSLGGVPAGAWHLRALLAASSFSPANFSNPLQVSGDMTGVVLDREAATTFAIVGRVSNRGEPVAGASVSAGGVSTVTDDSGAFVLSGLAPGSYALSAAAAGVELTPGSRNVTIENRDVGGQDFSVTTAGSPPFFTRAASVATPSDGPFVALTARANDDGGATLLRYTWSVVGNAPGPVEFLPNGNHAARDTVARFAASGAYRLRVTATDAWDASTSSEVSFTLAPVVSHLSIAPSAVVLPLGGGQAFSVRCTDQFGAATAAPAGVVWSASGGGTIGPDGRFTATAVGGGFTVTARAGLVSASGSVSVAYPPGPGTGITREWWSGVAGTTVAELTGAAAFPDHPTSVDLLEELVESRGMEGTGSGERLRGYFVPPVTGDHVFVIASADASELWLSGDWNHAGRRRIAAVAGATELRAWDAQPGQRSAPVALRAGQPVYFEVLHKSGGAGGHVSVGVELPGGVAERPIPADRLLPWGAAVYPPPRITVPAAANPAAVGAGLQSVLSVSATSEGGEAALTYTWDVVGERTAPVVFVPNGTNAARSVLARFSRAGVYTLRVTVRDRAGQAAESRVTVQVAETQVSWRNGFFGAGDLEDPALEGTVWGAEADPDGDGVVNLLEYAFELDPLLPDNGALPQPLMIDEAGVEYLAIVFRRNSRASDLVFTPQVSSDLQTWQGGLVPVGDPLATPATFRDFAPATGQPQRFIRVEVTAP